MDIPDSLSPLLPIVHCLQQVLGATSCILTELPYVGSSWSPCFDRTCERVHMSTSLMSSSLLLQQCPACLVRLILIVFLMSGWWPYSCCFVGCCLQHFSSDRLVNVHVVHPYSHINTTAAWKKLHFFYRSDLTSI